MPITRHEVCSHGHREEEDYEDKESSSGYREKVRKSLQNTVQTYVCFLFPYNTRKIS